MCAALYGLVEAARNSCRRVHALVVGSVHAVSSPGVHRIFGLIAFPSFGCWRTQSGAQIHDASLLGRFPGIAMFDAQWQSGYLDKSSCAIVLPFACLRVSRGAKLVNTAPPHFFRKRKLPNTFFGCSSPSLAPLGVGLALALLRVRLWAPRKPIIGTTWLRELGLQGVGSSPVCKLHAAVGRVCKLHSAAARVCKLHWRSKIACKLHRALVGV